VIGNYVPVAGVVRFIVSGRFLGAVVLACSLAGGGATAGDGRTLSPQSDISKKLHAVLTAATRSGGFNGSVLVARNGRVLLRKGYGYASVARGTPNRPNTRFRISSLTSTFNDVALLQLAERGELKLDGSVCTYVPRCPRTWQPMTVEMLLAGTSGLATVRPYPQRTRSLATWIDWLRAQPLAFHPGKGRDRSEARQLLAGYLVGRISGVSWLDYLTRHIFRPLRMSSTGRDRATAPRRATPYFRTKQRTLGRAASFPPLSEPDVVYGLMSTVDDVYRFDKALHSGRLVRSETLAQNRAPGGGNRTSHLELGHGPHGTADGWYTAYTHRDEDGVTILAFSNMGGYSLGDLESRLFFAAIDWPPQAVDVDSAILQRYLGRYTWRDPYYRRTVTIRISATDRGLQFWWDRFPPRRLGFPNRPWQGLLTPTSETTFYATFRSAGFEMLGWTFAFEVDSDGRTQAVVVSNKEGPRPVRYRRLATIEANRGLHDSTAANPSQEAMSSSSSRTALAIARVNLTSSWIALTRSTDDLRSAAASTFPTSRSSWRIGRAK
jgi:CubicO group peptidase (beta-lactamase class C family)